ncbi:MAG: DUF5686 and carboxypeptidase regulatory-like domain-containing protein [Tannerellaceae bacterium]|jgi:hypothetical protein|nr:DUF5686 and carboxypeptidase regulatory-like domain-containing protein [Tannerellaceae bacterium]
MIRFAFAAIILALFPPATIVGQGAKEVRGFVIDSLSGEPLANASLRIEGTSYAATTDDSGAFVLRCEGLPGERAYVRHIGYALREVPVRGGESSLRILLVPEAVELGGVVVRPKRSRYARRNNPAVDLIRRAIERKDYNRIEAAAQYKTAIYDRLTLGFAKTDTAIEDDILVRRLPFIRSYLDTSALTGNPALTLSVREQMSDYYYRRSPRSAKTVVRAVRREGLDRMLDDSGIIAGNFDEILKGVNIFDNDVNILLNRFVSPLSSALAVAYYKYFILDTLNVGSDRCVMLGFAPFNSESYAFTGYLYIVLDGTYAVRKAQLNVPRHINLNWVRRLRIEVEYARVDGDSLWAPRQEDLFADFMAMPGATELYAHRVRRFGPVDRAPKDADSVFALIGPVHISAGSGRRDDRYWSNARPVPLREKERAIGALQARLDSVALYRIATRTLGILIADYVPSHAKKDNSRFDFGPISSTYSSNYVEGPRFRIGGMTTAGLSPSLFASGYAAYGLADRKVKYLATLTYSFIPRDYHSKESPANNLSVLYGFDVSTPGQQFLSGNDNLILSQSVGQQITQMQYIRKAEIRYEKEWPNRLMLSLWARREDNRAAGDLQYINASDNRPAGNLSTAEIGLQLRYAPGERPYNGRDGRDAIFNLAKDAPVFRFSHRAGLRALGSDYTYHQTEAGIEKRIWLSSFGHVDAIARGGYIWNRLPFPLLIIPNTNQSAIIQPETFAMMRALEFVSDRYVSLFLTYYMKGWLFNRIPLLKRLQLREVLSFAGTYGRLSDKNNPSINPQGLYIFPEGSATFKKEPYIEVSAGIENIFNIVRIDYYRRLTYINSMNINRGGIRLGFRFSF